MMTATVIKVKQKLNYMRKSTVVLHFKSGPSGEIKILEIVYVATLRLRPAVYPAA